MVSTPTPTPETEIPQKDESISSSNKGINAALILTLVLSIVILGWAVLAVPHDTLSSKDSSKTGAASSVTPVNTRSIPDGTLGPVINVTGSESKTDASRLKTVKVQSDTISPVGPGGFAKDTQENPQTSKTPRN